MSDSPSIFTKIIAREIPADIVFESDAVIAFRDIAPQAPVHLLVVPKTEEFANVTELAAGNPALLAELVSVAQSLADEYAGGQYRLIFNTGENAGQTVFHVHAHVLGGNLEEGTLGH
ncbi:histidine triad (HIT) family protein [Salinibacterium amurskyense]|uniref:Histidine triad (HIT) family protein n=1 Tax=Salinibacterium amurskyense TaxID=205941 RepID=A0A2M9D8Y0_9MICO|nr:histidine triad nucleotide-binding protein [Salinibacterium amurskyense]PJJ82171.1 histidine triad (HIT) family protein [Salinibacterium amurskyense]RLQ81946.1 histidine triad nucleotide-binding protein [Salinibacterium amurskyense]GHD77903.1 histidine triad nucleotide-binding protein [Salinibacterium amurskyense]